jgi:hypothetical protein
MLTGRTAASMRPEVMNMHLCECHIAVSPAGVLEVLPGRRLRQAADQQAEASLAGDASATTTAQIQ